MAHWKFALSCLFLPAISLLLGPISKQSVLVDRRPCENKTFENWPTTALTLIRQACKSPSLFSGWSNLLFPREHVSFFDFLTLSVSTWTHFLGWLDSTGRNPEREGNRILEGGRTLISLPLDRKGLINAKHLSLRKVTNLVEKMISKYLLSWGSVVGEEGVVGMFCNLRPDRQPFQQKFWGPF